MKGVLTAALLMLTVFTAGNTARSQVLLNENFDYPAGDSLGAHGWVSFSGGSTNVLTVTTPGLTYTGYPGSGIGNAVSMSTSGQDAYTSLSSVDSSNSFYAAAMVTVSAAQAGDYVLAFLPSTSTTFYSGRLHIRSNGSGIDFGITKGAATDTTTAGIWTTGSYSLNTTYLVVLKYTFVAGSNNDLVSLFVLSGAIPSTEPTPTVGPLAYPSGDAFNLGRIALRQGTSSRAPTLRLDGIRVTRSWTSIITGVISQSGSVPSDFSLGQNYPNPFNPDTKIEFSIPEQGQVTLKVFDALGKEVQTLVDTRLNAGTFSVRFSGAGLSSGLYFYSLDYENGNKGIFSQTKKLILNK
ncbi:MAG: T9SS type A sorting domain-containing protein [Ignavibacteria bacterium]|nr:T9SS type A sorting domain-containing protein [Ignavibacteria bacterium]